MTYFTATFLVGALRITVEDMGSSLAIAIKLNAQRIGKFTSTVSYDHRE